MQYLYKKEQKASKSMSLRFWHVHIHVLVPYAIIQLSCRNDAVNNTKPLWTEIKTPKEESRPNDAQSIPKPCADRDSCFSSSARSTSVGKLTPHLSDLQEQTANTPLANFIKLLYTLYTCCAKVVTSSSRSPTLCTCHSASKWHFSRCSLLFVSVRDIGIQGCNVLQLSDLSAAHAAQAQAINLHKISISAVWGAPVWVQRSWLCQHPPPPGTQIHKAFGKPSWSQNGANISEMWLQVNTRGMPWYHKKIQ